MRAILFLIILNLAGCEVSINEEGEVTDVCPDVLYDNVPYHWGDSNQDSNVVFYYNNFEYTGYFLNEEEDSMVEVSEVEGHYDYDHCDYNYYEQFRSIASIELAKGEVRSIVFPSWAQQIDVSYGNTRSKRFYLSPRDEQEVIPVSNYYSSAYLYTESVLLESEFTEVEMEFGINESSFELELSGEIEVASVEGFEVDVEKLDKQTLKITPHSGSYYGAIRLKLKKKKVEQNTWATLSFKKCKGLLKCRGNTYNTTIWKFINTANNGGGYEEIL